MAHLRHKQLASPDQDIRYAAAVELAGADRIDPRDVLALVASLEDRGHGLESVPDHNGGYQDDAVPIADMAEQALRKHAAAHRTLLEELTRRARGGARDRLEAILRG